MISPRWNADAWADYVEWQTLDKRIAKRINMLIKDIMRNHFEGIGKPEPLKYDLSGWWSRRINDEHRLIYRTKSENLEILSCKTHYES